MLGEMPMRANTSPDKVRLLLHCREDLPHAASAGLDDVNR